MNTKSKLLLLAGAVAAGTAVAPLAAHAATPAAATAVTALHGLPDSGSHGNNWANDDSAGRRRSP